MFYKGKKYIYYFKAKLINKRPGLRRAQPPLFVAFCGLLITFAGCASFNSIEFQKELGVRLADTLATRESVLLFSNLKRLADERKIIFGHHNSTEYGIGWQWEEGRSDVKDVAGAFPGLYGWDFAGIKNYDTNKHTARITKLVKEAYKRGGINTFCWHFNNPVTGGLFYDTTIAVKHLLPGGSHYLKYLKYLDTIADYANALKDENGKPIPIIFRPWHEFDGSWFWWGKNFCTRDEFIKLWQVTVAYLRDYKNVRNFIYAFSSDRKFHTEAEFLDRYPGDEYVDIIGMDNYYDFTPEGDGLDWVTKKLAIITGICGRKNKVPALTETGLESIPDTLWWTDKLYKAVNNDSVRIAYLMVWRNANKIHHYAPYAGHPSSRNFISFKNKPNILFQDRLPDLYNSIIPVTERVSAAGKNKE